MEFRILGPLEARDGDRVLNLGGPKPRALLAALLVHANEPVPAERLAMALWGEDAAADAVKTLHVHVSRLRKALGGGDSLETAGGGYRLRVGPGELDAGRFEQLVADGRERLAAGDPERAAALLRDALALWRGSALADVDADGAAAARLEEQRLAALELRIEADLAGGRHGELVGELQELTASHPVRERLHGQLMLALYRSGRQADALDAYRRAHVHLAEELGLEPGAELRTLQAEVLAQSPALDLPAPPTGLPARGALLGREDDVRAVVDLLARDGVQLVTVTGIGGVGKTTLAVEVAHRMAARFPGGAAFIDLAPVSEPSGVADAALQVLGGTLEGGTATEALCRLLATRPRLLVLDNFEHVLDAAGLPVELMSSAPASKLLVTSRTALDLGGEQRYPLAPLDLPTTGAPADVAAAPASALFIARATARDPALELTADAAAAIAELCRRVDALPLAIELAAARASVLSPQEIAERLDTALGDLGHGPRDAPVRQRTLRATLDWSYALLEEEERAAFARLAVFAGGCDPDAAERVADAPLDIVERLVAKSMVLRRRGPDGETRFVMLEPVREYAAERLAELRERAAVEDRHGRYFAELAETAHVGLMGADQVGWGRRLDAEAANLRRALERAREAGDPERVLRIATAVDDWWFSRGLWGEGRAWVRWALDRAGEAVPAVLRAAGWQALGYLLWPEQDIAAVLAAAERSWALATAAGDVEAMVWSLELRGQAHMAAGDAAAAREAAVEAVRLAGDVDEQALGHALRLLAVTADEWAEVRETADRAATTLERAGDLRGLAWLWEDLAFEALADARIDEAAELIEHAIAVEPWLDDPADAPTRLVHHGIVAVEQGEDDVARTRLLDALEAYRARGIRATLSLALLGLAVVAARAGDHTRAGRLAGAAGAARVRGASNPLELRLETTARDEAGSSPQAWDEAVAAGRRLGWEESLALALDERALSAD